MVHTKHLVYRMLYLFKYETKTGVVRIMVIFQDRQVLGHIIKKVPARAFH